MMRYFFIYTLIAIAINCFAQDYEYSNYNWDAKPTYDSVTPEDKKADAVILKDLRVHEYAYKDDDIAVITTIHKIVLVNEDKAIEEYNKVYIPVSNSARLITLKARTLAPDGTINEINEDNIKDIPNLQDAGAFKIFALDNVQRGSIIEYFYTQEQQVEYFGREVFQGDAAIKNGTFQLISPPELIFAVKGYNGCPPVEKEIKNGRQFQTVTFKNIVALYPERYASYTPNLMRVEYKLEEVEGSGKGKLFTWNDAANYISGTVYAFSDKEKNDAEKFLDTLHLKKKSYEDKIIAIERAVKQSFQFQDADGENFEVPDKIFVTKFANEKGFTRMFALLFSQAQIEHQIVYTSDRTKIKFDPGFTSWNYLEHALFYFPQIKKFLDPSAFDFRLGLIPGIYTENYALFIMPQQDKKDFAVTSSTGYISGYDGRNSYDNMNMDISFPVSMEYAQIHAIHTLGGYSANAVQPYYNLIPPESQKQFTDAYLKAVGNDAVIEKTNVEHATLDDLYNNEPLAVVGDEKVSSLLEKAGKKYIFKLGNTIGEQIEMYEERPRQFLIELDYPHQYTRIIKIKIPDGYVAKGLDDIKIDRTFKNEKGEHSIGFVSDYTLNGNLLTVNVHEYYYDTYYPIEKINDFRTVINASADFNKVVIVFEPE